VRHSIGDLILRLVKNVRPEFWGKEGEEKKVDFSGGYGVSQGLSLPAPPSISATLCCCTSA